MLYFAASDPSGYGGSDIYVSLQDNKGKWGTPRNLGTKVNTTGNESCPFIHADNQTLYFSSDGHTGYGGEDLFVSRKQPNGSWSIALNLGYPINTIENEGSLIIAANGVTAYYASDRADSRGGLDIYTFDLRPEMQPTKTLYIKGTVIDSITKQPLISTIELYDINSPNTPLQKIQTNNTANFFVTLPVGKNYLLNVTRKGYLFYSANYNFTQTPPDTTYDAILPLQPILLNATITLQNIFYETNKFALDNKSTLELSKVLQLLTDNPTVRIEIGGHTDNVGQASKNLLLSANRSKGVVRYLVSKGINANRLVAKGYGQAKPVANNTTNEGKAGNRRTELKVIGL